MKWKNIKLGKKFFIAFGSIIMLLIVIATWAVVGIGGIVDNAEAVIEGNKLRNNLVNRHVDHLKWANQVSEFLSNDDVEELNVQLNPHECKFGKWYYSKEKDEIIELIPELEGLLNDIEDPHAKLHESAKHIKEVFQQANRKLSNELREVKSDHLIFAHRVKDVVVNAVAVNEISVQKDPNQCKFGKWLKSDETMALRRKYPEFDALCKAVKVPHNKLHNSVKVVENYYKTAEINAGKNYYMTVTKPTTYQVLDGIDKMLAWNDARLDNMDKANDIYFNETTEHLHSVGHILTELDEQSKKYMMTDEQMLASAQTTQMAVILISLIVVLIAFSVAVVISRGIVRPINKGVDFALEVAKGNLTATVNVNQKDEIGDLANALKGMVAKLQEIVANVITGADNIASASEQMSANSQQVSQGATEQASSAEEVSSSMEEMASNIQQNTDNAKQTEQIAAKAATDIQTGSGQVNETVNAMKQIAEKVSIIGDIAFQTNILALNAAVEAARAGEHGKGFAVVAAEVRKLAERSQVAAGEIDDLSKSSVEVAERAGGLLNEIVPDIQKTSKLVEEITAASIEMSSGSDQVNNAIQQLNQVTQENAASAEEMATGSEELSSQADNLRDLISFFKIDQKKQVKKNSSKAKPENKPRNIKQTDTK